MQTHLNDVSDDFHIYLESLYLSLYVTLFT